MVPLIILGLLAVTIICLLAALVFLYRYLSRSRLFPQLPRLWQGDKTRFILFLLMFFVFGVGFATASWLSQPPDIQPEPQKMAVESQIEVGPSFDGRPPPEPSQTPPPGQMAAANPEERALPPAEPQGQAPQTSPTGEERSLPPEARDSAQPAAAGQMEQAPVSTGETTSSTTTSSTTTSSTTSTTTSSTTTAPTTTQPPARAGKAYTACAASFKDRASAEKTAATFKKKGFSAQVVEVQLKEKGRWFRVCVGEFPTQAEAMAQAKLLKQKGLAGSPFPVRLR